MNCCSFTGWFVALLLLAGKCHSSEIQDRFSTLKTKTSPEDQVSAVEELLDRMFTKQLSSYFVLQVHPEYFAKRVDRDAFEYVSQNDGKVAVKATSGVALAAGVYHYLKYYCYIHVSWSGDQLHLPIPLPVVKEKVHIEFLSRFRYYQNVCTVSYSSVFWNWTRWEKEIDWMALNGINLPLAFTGQETVWWMVYLELGLTQQEIVQHFAGPAFLAWQRMGNLNTWGGPLPTSWYEHQFELQKKILQRMRKYGMIPVLPGFAGYVPRSVMDRLYPNASYTKGSTWNGFSGKYSTVLLNPTDPLFQVIGKMFLDKQAKMYNGTDHVYNADVFNEMLPPSKTAEYMSESSSAVFRAMQASDKDAVWLLQGWTFLQDFWNEELIKAWLNAVPMGKLIVLDLASELNPIYTKTKGYYGHPFVWCMIENFGGNQRMFGSLEAVMKETLWARANYPNMIGTGMTPEGIDQNHINFELMNEMAWRAEPFDVVAFGQEYARRRYGPNNVNQYILDSWKLLIKTVYNASSTIHNGGGTQGRLTMTRPYLTDKLPTVMWYNPSHLMQAWKYIDLGTAQGVKLTDSLRHDVVMIAVQVMEDVSGILYRNLAAAFANKSLTDLTKYALQLHKFLSDTDLALSASRYMLLGNWLESAKAMGANEVEKADLEFNARNQVTLWGPNGQISDYANKNWAGLVQSYYSMRWKSFTDELSDCLKEEREYDNSAFQAKLLKAEQQWGRDRSEHFSTQPIGNVLMISQHLYLTYAKLLLENQDALQVSWNEAREQTLSRKDATLKEFLKLRYHW